MNQIVNTFLMEGDKFMPEMHLQQLGQPGQPGVLYSACGPLTKHKKIVENFFRPVIQTISTKMSWIRLAFSMI